MNNLHVLNVALLNDIICKTRMEVIACPFEFDKLKFEGWDNINSEENISSLNFENYGGPSILSCQPKNIVLFIVMKRKHVYLYSCPSSSNFFPSFVSALSIVLCRS